MSIITLYYKIIFSVLLFFIGAVCYCYNISFYVYLMFSLFQAATAPTAARVSSTTTTTATPVRPSDRPSTSRPLYNTTGYSTKFTGNNYYNCVFSLSSTSCTSNYLKLIFINCGQFFQNY